MKRSWLPSGVLTAGLILIAVSFIGTAPGALHIVGMVRIGLLIAGLTVTAGALNSMRVLPIREYISHHQKTLSLLITALAISISGLLVLLAYVFLISVGKWTVWPPTTDYYDQLAQSFQAGQLSVKARPDASLLALTNPYDPDARKVLSALELERVDAIWDLSLYNGRLYLYWGPAPALLLLTIKLIHPIQVGDQQLTFAFLLASFVIQALLLLRIWRRFFPSAPAWTMIGALLLAGFVNPAPWLLSIPRIYEAAIAAGQFFLMAGLYFAFTGLDRLAPSRWRLALAATAWVCAVGSRGSLTIPVTFLGLMVLLWVMGNTDQGPALIGRLAPAAAICIPLLFGAILLAWYNFARFDSIFEFGYRYQLTFLDQNTYHTVLFSPRYILPNAYIYLFNAPSLDAIFPFVRPIWNGEFISSFNNRFHTIYNTERIIGLVYVAPFLLFALLPPALVAIGSVRARAGVKRAYTAPLPSMNLQLNSNTFFGWLLMALTGAALLELLVGFLVFYATMRYFLDVTQTLVIISVIGFWLGYRGLEKKPFWRAGYGALAIALVLFTVITGILVGFSSDVPRMKASNPALLAHLRLFFMSLARRLSN